MRGAETLTLEDMPFLDAGPLGDPFVAGIDHFGELGIAEHVGRHITVNSGDGGTERGFPGRFFGRGHAGAVTITLRGLRLSRMFWAMVGLERTSVNLNSPAHYLAPRGPARAGQYRERSTRLWRSAPRRQLP